MNATKNNAKKKIHEKRGNLSAVARSLGKSRTWLYNKLNDDWPCLWDDVKEARESLIDDAESELYKQALNKGNITALIFILKTQGKGRGWVERQEVEHSGKVEQVITVNWDDANN